MSSLYATIQVPTKRYSIKAGPGKWVHHGLADDAGNLVFTDRPDWRWTGKAAQLVKVRDRHPETRSMTIVEIAAPSLSSNIRSR